MAGDAAVDDADGGCPRRRAGRGAPGGCRGADRDRLAALAVQMVGREFARRRDPAQPGERAIDRPAARHAERHRSYVEPLDSLLALAGEAGLLDRRERGRIGVDRNHLAAHGGAEIGHLEPVAIGADQSLQPRRPRLSQIAGTGAKRIDLALGPIERVGGGSSDIADGAADVGQRRQQLRPRHRAGGDSQCRAQGQPPS